MRHRAESLLTRRGSDLASERLARRSGRRAALRRRPARAGRGRPAFRARRDVAGAPRRDPARARHLPSRRRPDPRQFAPRAGPVVRRDRGKQSERLHLDDTVRSPAPRPWTRRLRAEPGAIPPIDLGVARGAANVFNLDVVRRRPARIAFLRSPADGGAGRRVRVGAAASRRGADLPGAGGGKFRPRPGNPRPLPARRTPRGAQPLANPRPARQRGQRGLVGADQAHRPRPRRAEIVPVPGQRPVVGLRGTRVLRTAARWRAPTATCRGAKGSPTRSPPTSTSRRSCAPSPGTPAGCPGGGRSRARSIRTCGSTRSGKTGIVRPTRCCRTTCATSWRCSGCCPTRRRRSRRSSSTASCSTTTRNARPACVSR